MKVGGQPGNKNSTKKRLPWSQSLKRALTRLAADDGEEKPNYRRGMDRIADSVVRQAADGNKDAWQEIACRIEGKVGTTIELIGDPKKPIGVLPFEFITPDSETTGES